MKILICNAGSTSLKFKLYEMPQCKVLAKGAVERVGSSDDAIISYENLVVSIEIKEDNQNIPNYKSGISRFLSNLTSKECGVLRDVNEIERVGYKATLSKGHHGVHELNDEVIEGMKEWMPLAKLHNTAYIETINAMREVLPNALFVGAFEPGFHRDIPLERRIYGVPYEWYEKYGIQRLGYHGASHGYIADVLNEKSLQGYKAISCHLGGSSSVCGIENGKSIDISWGMTLQSGLIHANRVGDIDGDLYEFLLHEGLSMDQIREGYMQNGGLLGISGVSNDMRYVQEAARSGIERAQLAIDVFVSGIVHYIGAFYMDLGGLDYIVFTAGIGEKSPLIRKAVCEKLGAIGIELDYEKNVACRGEMDISGSGSSAKVLVIPTDEELGIARRTFEYK